MEQPDSQLSRKQEKHTVKCPLNQRNGEKETIYRWNRELLWGVKPCMEK